MKTNAVVSVRKLFLDLENQGLVTQEEGKRIAESFGSPEPQLRDPLYIRILAGFGAWVAALFLILFLGISHILQSGVGATIFGMIFLAGGIFIARASRSTFLNQLSLALAFAGNLLVLFGMGELFKFRDISAWVVTHAIVCAVMYPLFPNSIYRFIGPAALAALLTAWIFEKKAFVLIHFLIAGETLFAGELLLLKRRRRSVAPLVYSAATMLPVTLLFMNLTQVNIGRGVSVWSSGFHVPLWPSSVVLAAWLIYLYFRLAGGRNLSRDPLLILAVLSTILLGIFTTPGILVAISLLVVGYAFDDRILTGLSYLFLLCFLVLFYYALNIDLAHKSWVIAGSGAVLLLVRWVAGRYQPEDLRT